MLHHYDIVRRTCYSAPFQISVLPVLTKYYDTTGAIRTYRYINLDDKDKTDLLHLLQAYYIPSERLIYTLERPNMDAYMTGQSYPSLVSVFRETVYSSGPTIQTKQTYNIIGVICSRTMNIHIRQISANGVQTKPIYYIDYLCFRREHNLAKNTRAIFQTHEYNQRVIEPAVPISLFRKEVDLCRGIVPLIRYETITYYMRNLRIEPLPPDFQVIMIDTDFSDIHTFTTILATDPVFAISVCPDINVIVALVRSRDLHICILKQTAQVYAIYFFRNAHIKYEDLETADTPIGDTLELVASYHNINASDKVGQYASGDKWVNQLFYGGFLHSVRTILRTRVKTMERRGNKVIRKQAVQENYSILMLNTIGHNAIINAIWETNNSPIVKTDCAYYLYNLVYPKSPVATENCFVLV